MRACRRPCASVIHYSSWAVGAGTRAKWRPNWRNARRQGVIHLGYVADEHLPALYQRGAIVGRSLFYEGFGLPPVEMLGLRRRCSRFHGGAVAERRARSAI